MPCFEKWVYVALLTLIFLSSTFTFAGDRRDRPYMGPRDNSRISVPTENFQRPTGIISGPSKMISRPTSLMNSVQQNEREPHPAPPGNGRNRGNHYYRGPVYRNRHADNNTYITNNINNINTTVINTQSSFTGNATSTSGFTANTGHVNYANYQSQRPQRVGTHYNRTYYRHSSGGLIKQPSRIEFVDEHNNKRVIGANIQTVSLSAGWRDGRYFHAPAVRPVPVHNWPYTSYRSHTVFIGIDSHYRPYHWRSYCTAWHHCPPAPRHYGTIVYFRFGSGYGASYCRPAYHRKFVFVSIGGYWPADYHYVRYYWYGCHPHRWYGVCPTEVYIARPVVVQPVAYQTPVNSEYDYIPDSTTPTYYYDSLGNIVPDYAALADIRKRNAANNTPPALETLADKYFDTAVQAFEKGDYKKAASYFRDAVKVAPEDIVMPFSYVQALFADGQYSQAASVLRTALVNMTKSSDAQKTVFFPRGLYRDENILLAQIAKLENTINTEPFNADMKLLLGYQLLGVDQTDRASDVLINAGEEPANKQASDILLSLIEQIKNQTADPNAAH